MPDITFTIPDDVITAICANNGYQSVVRGQPNPQTPIEFVREYLRRAMVGETIAFDIRSKQQAIVPREPPVITSRLMPDKV